MCPYLKNGTTCNFFGTSQAEYQKKTYCLSSNWAGCENYKKRSEEERRNKRV